MQDQFFAHLRKTTLSDNRLVQFACVRLAKLARFMSRGLLAVFYHWLYLRAPENHRYTQGYRFVGVKRSNRASLDDAAYDTNGNPRLYSAWFGGWGPLAAVLPLPLPAHAHGRQAAARLCA
jgi:hypothetical protein